MTYRLAIYDDDPAQAEKLLAMVQQTPRAEELEIQTISNLAILRNELLADKIDILLMDIHIGGEAATGIDFIHENVSLQSNTQVIYVTGFDSYHTSVYRTQHTGFLTKPVKREDLNEVIGASLDHLAKFQERPFWVRTSTGEKVIQPRRLRYVESDRRILKLHVDDDVVETYGKLSDLLQRLPQRFVQCHKSFVVNMGFIDEFGRTDITLTSGERVPVSQKRRASVREAFFKFVGRGL